MAVPARPVEGAPVDTVWGGIAHDTAVAQDIQSGSANISLAASTQGSVTVTFPRPFASTPAVTAMLYSGAGGSLGLITQAASISATAVVLRLTSPSSTTIGPIGVSWIAVGPRT